MNSIYMKCLIIFVAVTAKYLTFATECDTTQESGFQCHSCTTASFCEGPESSYDVTCDANMLEVCWIDKEGVPCETPVGKTINSCGCLDPEGEKNLTGSFRDPYNPSAYFTCTNGLPSFEECQESEMYALTSGACVPEPSCEQDTSGYYPIVGDCNAFLVCDSNPITGTSSSLDFCPYEHIFDFSSQGCSVDFSCDGRIGEFADPFKPNLYYSCFGSPDVENTAHCCKPGQAYNLEIKQCSDKTEGGSTNVFNACLESVYENDYCRTCEGERDGFLYETWETCSRNYWECQEIDNRLHSMLKQCPENTFYDSTGNYCSTECPDS